MATALLDGWIGELEATLGVQPSSTGVAPAPAAAAAAAAATSPAAAAPPAKTMAPLPVGQRGEPGWAVGGLDIVVGRITSVRTHEESEKLFLEEIDIGEDEPRNIASGLRPFYEASHLQDRLVLVMANLKPRKMVGGFKSAGMVLCAANDAHDVVKFVDVPAGAKVGDRVVFDGVTQNPLSAAQVVKRKVCEAVFPELYVGEGGVCTYKGVNFSIAGCGDCTAPVPSGFHIS